MKSVGIDIGSYSIKLVEVEVTTKGYIISNFTEHLLSNSPAQDQEMEVLDFLQQVAKKYDPTQTKIVTSVRQEKLSVRHKYFPFRERQKIIKSLSFELEDDIPFAADSAVYDAKLVSYRGNQAEVLACACPKVYVAQAFAQLDDAGLTPSIISGEGLVLANLFEKFDEAPPQRPALPLLDLEDEKSADEDDIRNVTALIHMGHTRSLVAFYENNALIGVRSLLWGAKAIGQAIAQKYDLPLEPALKELQNKGFILTVREGATNDQQVFSDTIASAVKELVREVQLTFLEARSEMGVQVQSIVLSGGSSQIQNLGAYLTQQFEVPVNRFNIFSRFNSPRFEVTQKIDATAGLAVCLALEALRKPRNPALNLLKGEFAQQSQYLKQMVDRWAKTTAFLAAALILFFVYGFIRDRFAQSAADSAHNLMRDKAENLAKLDRKQMTVEGVNQWIQDQENMLRGLKKLEGLSEMNSALTVVSNVSAALPDRDKSKLEIQKMDVSDNRVKIEGWVRGGKNKVTEIQKALEKVAEKGKVQSAKSNIKAPSGAESFALSFAVDRNIKAQ